MATINDLNWAIFNVLTEGSIVDGKFVVPMREIKILQAEYNIHFREPEDKQVEIV